MMFFKSSSSFQRAACRGGAGGLCRRKMLLLSSSSSSSSSSTFSSTFSSVSEPPPPPPPASSTTTPSPPPLPPTTRQLRIVAMRAAIPMVGFGFMDNIVMIQAGEAIDMSLGVAFSLSTLTAAGFGQCISDVAGFTCGGIVDAIVNKMRLPQHGLSIAQLDLRSSRMYHTFGGCIGVVTGCLLGMSCLLFMDTDRAERAKKAKELQSIFETVLTQGHIILNAERATLWMLDDDNIVNNNNPENKVLWSRVATGTNGIIQAPVKGSLVGECVLTGQVINVKDVYQDVRFDKRVDEKTGFKTKSVLCHPVRHVDTNKIIGAIQIINKKKTKSINGNNDDDNKEVYFTDNDIKLVQMLASHVACFIKVIARGGD